MSLAELGFDPSSPEFLADPYPVYGRMREAGPILWHEQRQVYLLTRFEQVHASLRDRRLGRAFDHRYTAAEFGQPDPDPRWARWAESERWSLLNLEPPDHTRLRRLVSAVFTPRAVAALRPLIEDYSDRTLAAAMASGEVTGEFDLIADYAQPFSVAVICTLLGVPVTDGPRLLDWSHAIVKMYEISTDDEHRAAAERAAGEFIDYVRALMADRRTNPRDDLISQLICAPISTADQGDRLTPDEIVCTVIVLLNAGHEATVNTLGNGMRALLRHPDQWARVATGAVDPPTAVEEMIRWDGPLQMFERWVLADGVQVAGQALRAGERIVMLFGSANRDPARFADPDRFDIGRGDTGHIGFGGGTHFCIGAPLARLEIAVSLDRLRRDCPRIESVAEPEYEPFFVIRGLRELRVRW